MATYYIDPSGVDNIGRSGLTVEDAWASLSYACSRVTVAGSVIHPKPGTYTETAQSVLKVGVSIEGEGDLSIIKSHVVGTNFTIRAESLSQNYPGNQSISYIKMDGDNYSAYGAIAIRYRGNVQIHHCNILNFNFYGVSFVNGEPPTTYATGNRFYNNSVTNCSIYSSGNRGCLELQGQDGMLIYNNTMIASRADNNNGDVIYAVEGYLKNVKIYNNTLTKTYVPGTTYWDFAIEVWNWLGGNEIYGNLITGSIDIVLASKGASSYSAFIHNNIIRQPALKASQGVRGVLLEYSCSDVIIENNWIENVAQGVYLQQGGGVRTVSNIDIRYNIFSNIGALVNSTGWGIYWSVEERNDLADHINILNNVFIAATGAYSTMYGIGLPDVGVTSDVVVRNNIIQGFDNSPIYASGAGGTTIDTLSIENNLFYGNGNSNAPRYVSGMVPTNNTTQNNITSDPGFVSSVDFHITEASAAYKAGIDVGLSSDYDGVAVDDPPSIGAYEIPTKGVILVTDITVSGTGDATTIDTDDGTLQMIADVLPTDADDPSVSWSVIPGTGTAEISSAGVLSAITDGSVTVRATANDDSGIYDEIEITISNQEAPSSIGITLNTYRDYSSVELKSRAMVPDAENIDIEETAIICHKITTTAIRNAVGSGVNKVFGSSVSPEVNPWSGFGPTVRTVSTGSPKMLVNSAPIKGMMGGFFAGYNDSAVTPHYDTDPKGETASIIAGDTVHYEVTVNIGEARYTGDDIKGRENACQGIAMSLWTSDGALLFKKVSGVEYPMAEVIDINSVTDIVSFGEAPAYRLAGADLHKITSPLVPWYGTIECRIELVDCTPDVNEASPSASHYDWSGSHIICQIPGLEHFHKLLRLKEATSISNSGSGLYPPTVILEDFVTGSSGDAGHLSWEGAVINHSYTTSLEVTAWVEDWQGNVLTDVFEIRAATPYTANEDIYPYMDEMIWKSGGVDKDLPVDGYDLVVKIFFNGI